MEVLLEQAHRRGRGGLQHGPDLRAGHVCARRRRSCGWPAWRRAPRQASTRRTCAARARACWRRSTRPSRSAARPACAWRCRTSRPPGRGTGRWSTRRSRTIRARAQRGRRGGRRPLSVHGVLHRSRRGASELGFRRRPGRRAGAPARSGGPPARSARSFRSRATRTYWDSVMIGSTAPSGQRALQGDAAAWAAKELDVEPVDAAAAPDRHGRAAHRRDLLRHERGEHVADPGASPMS